MNKNVIIGIIVVLVLIVAVWAFANRGDEVDTDSESGTEQMTTEEYDMDMMGDASLEGDIIETTPIESPVTSPTGVTQGTLKEFAVSAVNFKFTPAEMQVTQGDTVRIVLTNNGSMPHDWRLDEFSAATKVIQPGQSDTVEFVAGEAGTFEYYCSVGQHRQLGMVGKLIVE
ncbi:MAG: cupredoxin domain-containing protein [Candidatus Andersenbacteria bacterium]|nr:cupredoxin domain-containing protein [Candidatus Andersenbacteria bacterium]MBI3250887.1 cupredoxin domain-containing protein [Candidatus Andersenbacteria bacterium]